MKALGALLLPRGAPGVVLEGSEKEIEKRGPPISYRSHSKGEGAGPYRTMSRESSRSRARSWERSRSRERSRERFRE